MKLKIQSPCHELIESMQIRSGEKFCEKCNKTVYDFSNYRQQEIIKILKHIGSGICARVPTKFVKTSSSKSLKYFLFTIFGYFILNHSKSIAQTIIQQGDKNFPQKFKSIQTNSAKTIYGTIKQSKTLTPLGGATVEIYNDSSIFGVLVTKRDGSFSFSLNQGTLIGKIKLVFINSGFKDFIIQDLQINKDMVFISLEMEEGHGSDDPSFFGKYTTGRFLDP